MTRACDETAAYDRYCDPPDEPSVRNGRCSECGNRVDRRGHLSNCIFYNDDFEPDGDDPDDFYDFDDRWY